jgi:hypothetical protein
VVAPFRSPANTHAICYLPRLGAFFADVRVQIFFQPGEGAFKGVVVLPVREIGEVIFADGFRQSFAGVRVQTCPFFNDAESVNGMGKSLRLFLAEEI